MRGSLAKKFRYALIGDHSDVVSERMSRVYAWETGVKKGREVNIRVISPPPRRAYKQYKGAYTHGGELKREMGKDVKRIAGLYSELHGKGVNRKVLSAKPDFLLDPLKS